MRDRSGSPGVPDQPFWRRIFWVPRTGSGWWSLGLAVGFFALLGVWQLLIRAGQGGGATFFEKPLPALAVLAAAASAIAGGVMGGLAVFRRRELSLLVFLAMLLGLFVLAFSLGELAGG